MSKILKLQNLKTYSAPFTNGVILQKGNVIRVSDVIAAAIEKGGRTNLDGDRTPYWAEQPEGSKLDHDFAPDTVGLADSAEKLDEGIAVGGTKPASRTASRQRTK